MMKHSRRNLSRSLHQPGFTLTEVLIAIIILLGVVLVSLFIFPRGFATFRNTMKVTTSRQIINSWFSDFEKHPENLPDAIVPVEWDITAFSQSGTGDLDFIQPFADTASLRWNDNRAVFYAPIFAIADPAGAKTANSIYLQPLPKGITVGWICYPEQNPGHKYRVANIFPDSVPSNPSVLVNGQVVLEPVFQSTVATDDLQQTSWGFGRWSPYLFNAAGVGIWPLWEPLSARVLRRVIGERCVVPSVVSAISLCAINNIVSITPSTTQTNAGTAELRVDTLAGLSQGMPVRVNFTDGSYLIAQVTYAIETNGVFTVRLDFVDNSTDQKFLKLTTWSNNATNLSSLISGVPKYTVNFGPIDVNNPLLAYRPVAEQIPWVSIYDLRYRKVNVSEMPVLLDNRDRLEDQLYYAINYDTREITLLPSSDTRSIRMVLFIRDNGGVLRQRFARWDIPVSPNQDTLVVQKIDAIGTIGDAQLVPGSEQLNRAYVFAAGINEGEWAKVANLASGTFFINRGSDPISGTIYFSRYDAGRKVKIDYTVADWNILHEEATTDVHGNLQITLLPKLFQRKTSGGRELTTFGLYRPMEVGDPVMALLDQTTGLAYNVIVGDVKKQATAFTVEPQTLNNNLAAHQITSIEFGKSSANFRVKGFPTGYKWRGLWTLAHANAGDYLVNDIVLNNHRYYVCIAAGTTEEPWKNAFLADENLRRWRDLLTASDIHRPDISSINFRVFYRAIDDWTVQFFRAPVIFWCLTTTKSFDSIRDVQSSDDLPELGWMSCAWEQANGLVAVPGIYEGQSVAVDYQYQKDVSSVLERVSGEMHTVPPRISGKSVSIFKLNNLPAAGTTLSVRGVSVTVRVLWSEDGSSQARIFHGEVETGSTIAERWISRQSTVILPSTTE